MKKTAKSHASSNRKISNPSFSIIVLLAFCSGLYYFLDDQFYDATSLTFIFVILFCQFVFFIFDAINLRNPINIEWMASIALIALVLFSASRNLNQINENSSFVCFSLMDTEGRNNYFRVNGNEFFIEPIRRNASTKSFTVTRGELSIYFAAREVSSKHYEIWYSQFANLKNIKNHTIIDCNL